MTLSVCDGDNTNDYNEDEDYKDPTDLIWYGSAEKFAQALVNKKLGPALNMCRRISAAIKIQRAWKNFAMHPDHSFAKRFCDTKTDVWGFSKKI